MSGPNACGWNAPSRTSFNSDQNAGGRIKIIDCNRELDHDAAIEKAKAAPAISAGANGFSFRSADTNFVLKVRGYFQADSRLYADDYAGGTANGTFLIRRARPIKPQLNK